MLKRAVSSCSFYFSLPIFPSTHSTQASGPRSPAPDLMKGSSGLWEPNLTFTLPHFLPPSFLTPQFPGSPPTSLTDTWLQILGWLPLRFPSPLSLFSHPRQSPQSSTIIKGVTSNASFHLALLDGSL